MNKYFRKIFWLLTVLLVLLGKMAAANVLDDFEDGDYTNNPSWDIVIFRPGMGLMSVVADPLDPGNLVLKGHGNEAAHHHIGTDLGTQVPWEGIRFSMDILVSSGYKYHPLVLLYTGDLSYYLGIGVSYDWDYHSLPMLNVYETGVQNMVPIPDYIEHPAEEWYRVAGWIEAGTQTMHVELRRAADNSILLAYSYMINKDLSTLSDIAKVRIGIEEFGWQYVDNVTLSYAVVNSPPIANASGEQIINCAPLEGAEVTLDGSGSSDPDDDPLTYTWTEGTTELGNGETLTLTLEPGEHTITLTVDDGNGGTDDDEVVITINADNEPPVITCPDDMTVNTDPGVCTAVVEFTVAATDNCDDDVEIVCDPASGSTFELGETTVTCTATDDNGNEATAEFTVTVVDNEAPVITCPENMTVSTDPGVCTAMVKFNVTAEDNCDEDIDIVCNPASGSTFPLDETTVTCTATDDYGNESTEEFTITVVDNELPVITVITDRITLWPPNHKYETISLSDLVVSVSDNCADLNVEDVVLTKATSDEEEDVKGGGDGNTLNDIAFPNGCGSVDLRAERVGDGNGRVYTIHLALSDGNNNIGEATCIVQVPHDKKDTAVDDGSIYEVASGSLPKRIGDSQFVSGQQSLPEGYALLPNHPNPFNPTTEITYTLPKDSDVGLMIFNLSGQLVRILDAGQRSAGFHTVQWDATDDDGNRVASGVYLVVLKAGHFVAQQRMVFMK